MRLTPGKPVRANPILFEAVRIACQIAEGSGGAVAKGLAVRRRRELAAYGDFAIDAGGDLSDALATAAVVLGPGDGIPFLTSMGVEGRIVTSDGQRFETRDLRHA